MSKRIVNFRVRVDDTFMFLNDFNQTKLFSVDFTGKEVTWQMSTGIEDIKGELVYEGDILNFIVSSCEEQKYEVKFGTFENWEIKGTGFYLRSLDTGITTDPISFHFGYNRKKFEVIGNIFDNADWLAQNDATAPYNIDI